MANIRLFQPETISTELKNILKSEKIPYEKKQQEIAEYLLKVIEKNIEFDIHPLIEPVFGSVRYFQLFFEFNKNEPCRAVYAYYLASLKSTQLQDIASQKRYIHELVEANHAMALDVMLRKNSKLLYGEWLRHFTHSALDGISKISNIELAIKLGSIEALKVLLKHSELNILICVGEIKTILDYGVVHTGKERNLDCIRLLLVECLKNLLDFIKQKKLPAGKTVKQYGESLGAFIVPSFAHTISLVKKYDKKDLLQPIEHAANMLNLPLDKFEQALKVLENEAVLKPVAEEKSISNMGLKQ